MSGLYKYKDYAVIVTVLVCFAGGCKSEQRGSSEAGRMRAAYGFLFEKVEKDGGRLIASEGDVDWEMIVEVIESEKMELGVERYGNIARDSSLCYYSKATGEMVAVVRVARRGENTYYVSYYLGPEGGASKEIEIEKRDGKWAVVTGDERWEVK
ncbi:MAG: hypothetical protein JSW23_03735 [Planctomycetota bacterium]|nr:MAG: hypothetical protein JSW23_03735 [Planctomycetota bacterium]